MPRTTSAAPSSAATTSADTTRTAAPHPSGAPAPHRRWLALTVLLIPAGLTLLSVTSINVALPSIRAALGASASDQSLVLTSYALVFALVLLPAGVLGDRIGHKGVFITGTLIFTAASLWCGLATSPVSLVLGRSLAGVGGGLAMTPVTALIQLLYTGPERARPFGIMGAVFGASSALGPLIGGLLIHLGGDAGWRWTFLINVPLGLLAAVAAIFVLPRTEPAAARGADPVGLLLFTLGLTAAILPFSRGARPGVGDAALLVAGILLLIGVGLWGRRRERQDRPAAVPVRLLRQRALVIGLITTFLGYAGFTASFLMLAMLWQDALGHDALAAGILVAPFALGSVVSAVASHRFFPRLGIHLVTAGLTLIALGMVAVGLIVLLRDPARLTLGVMVLPLLVTGLGVGCFTGPTTNASVVQTERRDAGVASALVTASQRVGTAVGIGVLSALYAAAPGGPTRLPTQGLAAFVTAAFALAGAVVLVASRRHRLDRAA